MKTNVISHPAGRGRASPWEPFKNAEEEMDLLVEQLQEGLVHASERPEIEGRILCFLEGSNGPTTIGVAAEMGISPTAAAFHLEELMEANRVWRQPSHGAEVTWHISLEGRHYMAERGLCRKDFAAPLFARQEWD